MTRKLWPLRFDLKPVYCNRQTARGLPGWSPEGREGWIWKNSKILQGCCEPGDLTASGTGQLWERPLWCSHSPVSGTFRQGKEKASFLLPLLCKRQHQDQCIQSASLSDLNRTGSSCLVPLAHDGTGFLREVSGRSHRPQQLCTVGALTWQETWGSETLCGQTAVTYLDSVGFWTQVCLALNPMVFALCQPVVLQSQWGVCHGRDSGESPGRDKLAEEMCT